jgi:predicted ester cyclase
VLGGALTRVTGGYAGMSVPKQVEQFYQRIWNDGDFAAMADLLTVDFTFRGSLGMELQGRDAFTEYVRSVRTALGDYRCEILDCVAEGPQAFAKMRFGGIHVATFRGFPPTGRPVHWLGAALFRFTGTAISDLWVLGDLEGLDELLRRSYLR